MSVMDSTHAQLILEIWDLFEEHIPQKSRDDIAENYLSIFEEFGIYPDELDDLEGENKHIDRALETFKDEELEENSDWDE